MEERDVLETIAWAEQHFGSLVPNELCPREEVLKAVEAGLAHSVGAVVLCDGDGFTLRPEVWDEGFALTDAGHIHLRQQEAVRAVAKLENETSAVPSSEDIHFCLLSVCGKFNEPHQDGNTGEWDHGPQCWWEGGTEIIALEGEHGQLGRLVKHKDCLLASHSNEVKQREEPDRSSICGQIDKNTNLTKSDLSRCLPNTNSPGRER
jgi:hypothetical protein